jgi:hypothetical protein
MASNKFSVHQRLDALENAIGAQQSENKQIRLLISELNTKLDGFLSANKKTGEYLQWLRERTAAGTRK